MDARRVARWVARMALWVVVWEEQTARQKVGEMARPRAEGRGAAMVAARALVRVWAWECW
jgi:hypothetical protein